MQARVIRPEEAASITLKRTVFRYGFRADDVDGRVVGGWAQRRSGEVVPRLLEDVGSEAERRVEAEVARVEAWIGSARVTGSFPTPLEIGLQSDE